MRISVQLFAIAFCALFSTGCTTRTAVYSDSVENLDYGIFTEYPVPEEGAE